MKLLRSMAANNTDGDGDYNGNVRVVPGSYYYVFTTPYTFYETYNEDDGDVYTNTPDHRNYSTLSFIVSATLILPALISIAQALKNLCNRKIKAFAHHHSFYMWILIACLLSCIIDILNLFDNFLNKDAQLKSGHSCYYIYAFKGAMIMSVGVGLCLVSMDILLNVLERGKSCFYIQERSLRLHITCFVIMCLCFVLNDLPDITGLIVHTYIHSCWEGNAYGFHAHFIGKLDLSIQLILISTMLVICGAIVCTMKVKVKRNNMVITPEFMLSALEDVDDEVINVQENARMEGESQGLSSDIADRQGDGGHNNLKDVQNLEDLMSDDTDEIHRKSYRKLPRYSSQRLRRVRIHQDNFSSESSGHENSGYMSDCCDDVMAIDYQKSSGNESTNLSDADLSALMLQKLSVLLFAILTSYNNTDVQDKAKLYYCLITSASDTKVKSVLQATPSDVESMSQALTSLLPGSNEKSLLAKIIQLDDGAMFTWERLSVDVCCSRKGISAADLEHTADGVSFYEKQLESLELIVELKCKLTLGPKSLHETIHAVAVSLENTYNFQPIPKVHVPCLAKNKSQEIVTRLQPIQPLPQCFHCSVDFCDDSKQTYTTHLSPIDVEFHHMMMPLPWKPSDENKADGFFLEVWDWVLRTSENGDRSGIESVKLFDLSPQEVLQAHNKHLAAFLCSAKQDYHSSYYGIFLPPSHHVLLKFKGQGQGKPTVTVAMAMNLKTLLPHVDMFLKNILVKH